MPANKDRVKLDEIDIKILQILQVRGRITNAKLASEVGLSAPPMLERVKKLERSGVIKCYRAILEANLLDRNFFVFVTLNLNVQHLSNVDEFELELAAMKEVLEVHHIAGDIDFLLKVNVKDQEDYKQFVVDNLAKIRGISRIHSWVVLSTVKDTTEYHIDETSIRK
ncbi:Lrp/AsnC family transcriptional regulator [Acanthopleuribacter pedis]|uniref:Lrp/AsnC family transcriptional regulator n=1 Tax=Acanthopleuribacter pedis TaxID=442870 RepID=A0A8J7Q1S9_9BACT|nr:Lrp/AsnC family transcriptional regulator [Acanthopleuribacter pedis]MBO1318877.1 Lrp/AsnC family transcriptional regulator [Acanthopleuribacter pedis]